MLSHVASGNTGFLCCYNFQMHSLFVVIKNNNIGTIKSDRQNNWPKNNQILDKNIVSKQREVSQFSENCLTLKSYKNVKYFDETIFIEWIKVYLSFFIHFYRGKVIINFQIVQMAKFIDLFLHNNRKKPGKPTLKRQICSKSFCQTWI